MAFLFISDFALSNKSFIFNYDFSYFSKMKKLRWSLLLFLSIAFFCLATCLSATAQKLAGTQQASLRAPANIKIDGKATEWGNQFQAYNKNTQVYYTIANDDDNLYLIIQSKRTDINNKILLGGVTFTINSSGKKNDRSGISITFPIIDKKDQAHIKLKDQPQLTSDTLSSKMRSDSFKRVINKELIDKSRYIGVIGVKSITDSVISKYNDVGIKAFALFDDQIYYTYELKVPIKYLGLSINSPAKFNYQIKLSGAAANGGAIKQSPDGRHLIVYSGGQIAYAMVAAPQYMNMAYPTDFWGEYTLAK
jgi:hypothetical protein